VSKQWLSGEKKDAEEEICHETAVEQCMPARQVTADMQS